MSSEYVKGKTKYGTTLWVIGKNEVCGKVILYDCVTSKAAAIAENPKMECQVTPDDIELETD